MAVITYDAAGPGAGAARPVFANSPRAMKLITGSFAFDNSYPTGGEDLSELFARFKELRQIQIDQPLTGAQTGKFAEVNYSTQKLLLYTNASPAVEVANASDQSAITDLRFVAFGYA